MNRCQSLIDSPSHVFFLLWETRVEAVKQLKVLERFKAHHPKGKALVGLWQVHQDFEFKDPGN